MPNQIQKLPETQHRLKELSFNFGEDPFCSSMKLQTLQRGVAIVSMTVDEKIITKEGFANGGSLVELADAAGVYAAMSCIETGHTKLTDVSMQFRRPARKGAELIAISHVKEESRQFIWVVAEIREDETNKLIAFGSLKFIKPRE